MANPEKRRATIIERYGSMEAFQKRVNEKRKQTLIENYGMDGYLELQRNSGRTGGKKSKRGLAKKNSTK